MKECIWCKGDCKLDCKSKINKMKRQFKHIPTGDIVKDLYENGVFYNKVGGTMQECYFAGNDWVEITKPEYTILSFNYKNDTSKRLFVLNNKNNFVTEGDDFYKDGGSALEQMLKHDFPEIHSVRRESDGEVFTVGDTCRGGKIISIKLTLKELAIDFDLLNGSVTINSNFLEKVQPKEWEITSFIHNGSNGVTKGYVVKLRNGSLENKYQTMHESHYLNSSCWSINSIKRLSDNVEFKIGDNIQFTLGSTKFPFEITNFILRDTIYAENNITEQAIGISNIQKIERLFVTDDGVDIYENNKVYEVFTDFSIHEYLTWKKYYGNNGAPMQNKKTFSTKEKAEEYILMNKKLFSVKNILEMDLKNSIFGDYIKIKAKELLNG